MTENPKLKQQPGDQREDHPDQSGLRSTALVGGGILAILTAIYLLSGEFVYGSKSNRPILTVTSLFIFGTLISLLAIRFAATINNSKRSLIWVIILFAIIFRGVMVFSPPILEVDLYRYMWDGKVANVNVSPYKFSPAQVEAGDIGVTDSDFEAVLQLTEKSQVDAEVLHRIHFKDFSTIYPPVSQFVFQSTMKLMPESAGIDAHIYTMKFVLVLFDIATIFLVLFLIVKTKTHPAWLIAYAWNPLVVKEVANSGHLDSIAVFLMVLATCGVVMCWTSPSGKSRMRFGSVVLTAVSLALATGAKIFPVILFPAITVVIWKRSWKSSAAFVLICLPLMLAVMWPMARENTEFNRLIKKFSTEADSGSQLDVQKIKSQFSANAINDPNMQALPANQDGLTSFLKNWRMNDLVFSFIYYNVEPNLKSELDRAWFAFVPNESRIDWYDWIAKKTETNNPAFFAARVFTVLLFGIAYLFILWRLFRLKEAEDTRELLACFFGVLAVFFMLQPTQNPWYWVWAVPFVIFARNRGWLVVSALLLVYYYRFWFTSLPGEFSVGSYRYSGTGLFDYVVIFLEYSVIFGTIIWFWARERMAFLNRSVEGSSA